MEFELLIHFHTLFHNVFLHLLWDTAFKYSKYTSQKIQRKHDIYEQGLTIGATIAIWIPANFVCECWSKLLQKLWRNPKNNNLKTMIIYICIFCIKKLYNWQDYWALQHATLRCRSEVFAKPTVSTWGLRLSYKYVEHPVSERLLKVDVFI